MIHCQKLKQQLPALEEAPLPGEIGQKILSSISQSAWQLWLEEQTKIINELKLQTFKKESQDILKAHMLHFLFNDTLDPKFDFKNQNKPTSVDPKEI